MEHKASAGAMRGKLSNSSLVWWFGTSLLFCREQVQENFRTGTTLESKVF